MKPEKKDQENSRLVTRKLELSSRSLGELATAFTDKNLKISFAATGFSMQPFIRPGMQVTIIPYEDRPPSRGDIVAYIDKEKNRLICHRIIKITDISFTAKGDNCSTPDPIHPKTAIVGRLSIVSASRFYNRFMQSDAIKTILTFLNTKGILYRINKIIFSQL